ncbi:hypothetical protein GCM10007359_03720 [Rothia aerolata]|uniref:Uncharacterized protein n=1 Tax=Rothia aerolata TaxID=1812262 RepID=A0A917MQH2_9MICC|nr:hypothetical protein GCM10007359_03720 [Rothia aerolata]
MARHKEGTEDGIAEAPQPVWLNVALAVWSFLIGGQGMLSVLNTPGSAGAAARTFE